MTAVVVGRGGGAALAAAGTAAPREAVDHIFFLPSKGGVQLGLDGGVISNQL